MPPLLVLSDWATWLIYAAFAISGIFLVARVPAQPIGWLLFGCALLFAIVGTEVDGSAADVVGGHAGARDTLLAWLDSWGAAAFFVAIAAIAHVFPSGRLPRRTIGVIARTSIAMSLMCAMALALSPELPLTFADGSSAVIRNPVGIARGWGGWEIISVAIYPVTLATLALAVGAMVIRFRRARGVERQQFKWLLAAVSGALGTVGFAFAMLLLDPTGTWMWFPAVFAYPMIPLAIGVTVRRYRLYDIDRVVSRTAAYLIVTVILAAVFFGVVLALQTVARPITGDSQLAVALSTITVVALFGPVRRRVQAEVDRRFDRIHYDAARVVASFSARLRDELDVDSVRRELARAANITLGPDRVSIWLRHRPGAATGTVSEPRITTGGSPSTGAPRRR